MCRLGNKTSEILRAPKLVDTLCFLQGALGSSVILCGNVVFGERVFRAAAATAPESAGSWSSGARHHVLNAPTENGSPLGTVDPEVYMYLDLLISTYVIFTPQCVSFNDVTSTPKEDHGPKIVGYAGISCR